jgi:pyroglutamyl-peptidase
MVILLTGFAPFAGDAINPSWEAVRGFDGQRFGAAEVIARELPTAFGQSGAVLAGLITHYDPAICLCFGQAGGRSTMSLEKIAINWADAAIPDNIGQQPRDQPLIPGAPAAYFAPIAITKLVQALQQAGIAAELSLSAGSFVCNDLYYQLCHIQATSKPAMQACFIHIPYAPEQVSNHTDIPSMPLAEVQKAIVVMLELLTH